MGLPKDDGRVVVFDEYWAALVPFWATWPFEILRMSGCSVTSVVQI